MRERKGLQDREHQEQKAHVRLCEHHCLQSSGGRQVGKGLVGSDGPQWGLVGKGDRRLKSTHQGLVYGQACYYTITSCHSLVTRRLC